MAGKGIITAANFAASMAVMLCSSPEAIEGRYVLLFRIYDIFCGGTLERASLKRVLSIAYPDVARSELTGAIDDFFGKSSVLEYEEFRWRLSACTISKRHVGKLLTGWFYTICNHLMDEPDPELVALEQRYNSERDLWKVGVYWNDRIILILLMVWCLGRLMGLGQATVKVKKKERKKKIYIYISYILSISHSFVIVEISNLFLSCSKNCCTTAFSTLYFSVRI